MSSARCRSRRDAREMMGAVPAGESRRSHGRRIKSVWWTQRVNGTGLCEPQSELTLIKSRSAAQRTMPTVPPLAMSSGTSSSSTLADDGLDDIPADKLARLARRWCASGPLRESGLRTRMSVLALGGQLPRPFESKRSPHTINTRVLDAVEDPVDHALPRDGQQRLDLAGRPPQPRRTASVRFRAFVIVRHSRGRLDQWVQVRAIPAQDHGPKLRLGKLRRVQRSSGSEHAQRLSSEHGLGCLSGAA